jgi:hypothetical protein
MHFFCLSPSLAARGCLWNHESACLRAQHPAEPSYLQALGILSSSVKLAQEKSEADRTEAQRLGGSQNRQPNAKSSR